MDKKEFSKLSDQELLAEAKKMKSTAIINALLIGFMIGIIIYSIWQKSVGVFTFIPLFFIIKILQDSKKSKALLAALKERKLK